MFELSFDKFDRSKKVALWRKLYRYKQRANGKEYLTKGIVDEIGGKRIERGIIIPIEKVKEILNFLHQEKIGYTVREVWSDNI